MNTFIRLLYAILIAAAVVTFVGVGIYTFYPSPQQPENPQTPAIAQKGEVSEITQAQQAAYDQAYKQFQDDSKVYSRNISIIGTVMAVGIVAAGLFVRRHNGIIGEGLSLGGIATSIYGVTTAVMSEDRIIRFVAVTVFLASAIVVVYVQFSEKKPAPTKAK